jgi:hypothetical protein
MGLSWDSPQSMRPLAATSPGPNVCGCALGTNDSVRTWDAENCVSDTACPDSRLGRP